MTNDVGEQKEGTKGIASHIVSLRETSLTEGASICHPTMK